MRDNILPLQCSLSHPKSCNEAVAAQGSGMTRKHLTVATGYKRSIRDAYVQRLIARGLIPVASDRLHATARW